MGQAEQTRAIAPSSGGVQAVEFALNILEYIAQRQTTVGVSELARAFGTTKSRVHRHLQTLVAAGYLVRDQDLERYSISARLIVLGQAVSENFELASAARQVARELRDRLGHAVAVSQPEKDGNRILLVMSGRSNIEIHVKPGSLLKFHSSAQGKITMAFGDPLILPQVLNSRLEMSTPFTITDPARLNDEVAAARQRQWAVAPNESMVGLNALAAPIFNALGGYVGAIAITDSVQFLPETPSTEQVSEVLGAAEKISHNLGFRSKTSW